jgi:hypothetical protein
MKKIYFGILIVFIFSASLVFTKTAQAAKAGWKPATPDGYTPITWVKAPGIATFFKVPSGNGSIDFLTRIYLPQNQIGFIASTSIPLDWGPTDFNFTSDITVPDPAASNTSTTDPLMTAGTTADTVATSSFHNYAFARLVAEAAKQTAASAKFIWNAPFFNITNSISDLSLALKSTVGTTTLITGGSRPAADMAKERHMLIINNQTASAVIENFDPANFVSSSIGDQALEGFAPTVAINDDSSGAAARLFLGVSTSSKELVVYCSQRATIQEASDALLAAGIPPEQQLEADGGSSAACGYNLPGQFFVEPARMLPLLMGSVTIVARGTATTNGLNVRSGPSTKHSIVAKLPKGAAVRALEEKNGWYRIGDGQWVIKTLIKKI